MRGDTTDTEFPDCYFNAVTCLSVIEHGIAIEEYFREMFRVLKPGGLLITSTDYYPTPIDTRNKIAHGSPIKIFAKSDIESMLELAKRCGFKPTAETIDLECFARPVHWELYELDYTFNIFTVLKP